MFVYFPHLHPELAATPLPAGTLFFDPGATDGPELQRFRPAGLPLAPREARRLLADCLRFGEQFRHPGEMAALGLAEARARGAESERGITAELAARIGQAAAGRADRPGEAQAAVAQFVLLLAWLFEERLIEMRGLAQELNTSWRRFGEVLGLAAGEAEDQALAEALAEAGGDLGPQEPTPWPRILEALAHFLPEDAVLLTADYEIGAALAEAGVALEPAPADLGLPGSVRLAEAPLGRILGRGEAARRPIDARRMRLALL